MKFKENTSFQKRLEEAKRIRDKYPDRIPCIVEKNPRSNVSDIDKNKYLVPCDLTLGQFIYIIRKKIRLSSEQSLFVFIDKVDVIPPTSMLMSEIYRQYADKDNFLYFIYTSENTFGK